MILPVIGELIGTYMLLTLGFVISEFINYFLYPKSQTRYITGFYWGLSILVPSLICTKFFHTANFSPIFSIIQFVNAQISFPVLIGEIIAQIISAWAAAYTTWWIWNRYLYTLPINLNFFSTVPRYHDRNWYNFAWELFGTALLAINSQILGLFNSGIIGNWFTKTIISWLVVTFAIGLVSPITGAAFNPTRDLVPRAFFSHKFGPELSEWHYFWIPLFGPLAGATIIMMIKFTLQAIW